MSHRLDLLYKKTIKIVEKEIAHLDNLSIGDKLPTGFAKDLVAYVKLLEDMKDMDVRRKQDNKARREAKAKAQTDEQLQATLNAPTKPFPGSKP